VLCLAVLSRIVGVKRISMTLDLNLVFLPVCPGPLLLWAAPTPSCPPSCASLPPSWQPPQAPVSHAPIEAASRSTEPRYCWHTSCSPPTHGLSAGSDHFLVVLGSVPTGLSSNYCPAQLAGFHNFLNKNALAVTESLSFLDL
jgi:hypothetical protein